MLIVFTIWFIVIAGFVMANIMSGIIPFLNSYEDIGKYTESYYNSKSAMEMALLDVKYWLNDNKNDWIDISWGNGNTTNKIWWGNTSYLYADAKSIEYDQADLSKIYKVDLGDKTLTELVFRISSSVGSEDKIEIWDSKLTTLQSKTNTSQKIGDVIFIKQGTSLYFWLDANDNTVREVKATFNWDITNSVYTVEGKGTLDNGEYQVILIQEKDTYNMKSPNFKKKLFPKQ